MMWLFYGKINNYNIMYWLFIPQNKVKLGYHWKKKENHVNLFLLLTTTIHKHDKYKYKVKNLNNNKYNHNKNKNKNQSKNPNPNIKNPKNHNLLMFQIHKLKNHHQFLPSYNNSHNNLKKNNRK